MGINPILLKQFINRELDEYDWIKEATHKDLNYELSLLDPKPEFYQDPYLHQKACFLIGVTNPKFCFFLDMGTGKTALTLSLLNYYMKLGKISRTLVLVPNQVAIESWDEQCKMFTPNLKHIPLFGSSEKRLQLLQEDADIYTINYAGLYHLCCERVKPKGKKKGRLVINASMVKAFRKFFNAIILDESHLVKNHQSLTYRVVSQIAPACKVRYALTGTPFGRDPQDFWSQFKIIDDGETFGKSLGLFREAYFTKKKNYFGGFDYKLNKKYEKDFQKALKHRSIWYDEKECQDLPKLVPITIKLSMPDVYKAYAKSIREQVIELQGDKKKLKGAFIKMRQLASGFLAINDEGDKVQIDFGENPRLEMLMELIDDMPAASKMVVFHEFIHSGDLIQKELRKKKIKSARLGTGAKDPAKEYKTFKTDPKCRIFVVNNHAGSMALNLQNANYCVYYESPVSPIDRKQSQKRCHRGGQTKKVFMYDLIMKNTVDERIQAFLKEGRDLFSALMDPNSDIDELFGTKK